MDTVLQPMRLEYLTLREDLAARAGLLAARLEKKEYRPETILSMDQAGWPGDWEGRTILALVLLAQATKKEPAYLHKIVRAVLEGRNERGYLGHILPDGEADEQQLSGHSWLMRGLIAYYQYTGDESIRDAVVTIGRNLFLPVKVLYPSYPIKPEERVYGGGAAGNVAGMVGGWHISTDTGCAYIPLDGVSALYELTEDPEIGALLDVMIENFLKIDFIGIKAQTHATLTATRGILRTYTVTGKGEYLDAAKKLFALYVEHGMTANYANYNWFMRPEWTEPCAIIDSFIAAMQLYSATEERDYLTYAQRILYNGMGFGQRENGGFGCDCCLGAEGEPDNHILQVKIPEAYWCCSMRGGEGLSAVGRYAFLCDPENRMLTIPYMISGEAILGFTEEELCIRTETSYPYSGNYIFAVEEENLSEPVTVCVYLPDSAAKVVCTGAVYEQSGGMLYIELQPGCKGFTLTFDLPVTAETPVGAHSDKSRKGYFKGNMMLSIPAEETEQFPSPDDPRLVPLYDAYENGHAPRQVLFKV
ncbi:MAG: glycoside hydrolase family 127 protein [Clostridia bacterium]|nr:glycoside hydrolase family 127 protein [Clostridia bacterium]